MDSKTLTDNIASRLNMSHNNVLNLLRGLTEVMGECGADLDNVIIPSFGSFEARKREERIALHPATGKKLLVPPKVYVNFKPSPQLKQKVRYGE